MIGDQETIISSNLNSDGANMNNAGSSFFQKLFKNKLFLGFGIFLILILIGFGIIAILKNSASKKSPKVTAVVTTPVNTSSPAVLPNLDSPLNASSTTATTSISNVAVEYLSFADFYKAPDNIIEVKFKDYELPLNVKIDVLNYYDLSRKLNLDSAIDSLNTYGFATIANPWEKDFPDFYSLYTNLEAKQIPVLVTSDFIINYYQTISKNVYKDIEESIFYDNLWSINKDLYESAKNRYEARLASIGDINDSILEGERLETTFFAVALELLKPAATQINPKDKSADNNKFSVNEADTFYFVAPPYLRDDVIKEVKLIREARDTAKSPVMLYSRDYKDFVVPVDYRNNARLNNFYLTSKWLNSVFPLNYRDANCKTCLVDKDDWRLSMIAASFISNDFSDLPELKNKWARIYKVMSYFNPLRDDLSYVKYRDALKSVFGEKYNIEELFNDSNAEAKNNLQKLQAKLNSLEFSPFLGAIDKTDPTVSIRRGFKVLVENYSPNDYIFANLTYPKVDNYQGASAQLGNNNITACKINSINRRCNGVALDVVNLISPIVNNPIFLQNTSYANYNKESQNLKTKLNSDTVWRTANYWTNLSTLSAFLNVEKNSLPLFAKSDAWRDRTLNTAVGAWVNLQLPVQKYSLSKSLDSQSLMAFAQYAENSYVEPNLSLVNELLSDTVMMQKMFSALQIDKEVISVPDRLLSLNNDLTKLKSIIEKELAGQTLVSEDNAFINNFAKQLTIEKLTTAEQQLSVKPLNAKNGFKEDLSHLKLMVLIHQEGNNKVISVGPVWNSLESRN